MHLAPAPRWALLLAIALAAGCSSKGADPKPSPPAKVEKPAKEIEIGTITLTPEAEARLAIRTAPIEKRKIARARTLGGEAVVPQGASAIVSAPVSGTIKLAGDTAPRPRSAVAKGQVLFILSLTSSERIRFAESKASITSSRAEAESDVARSKVEVAAARVALERAEKLASENVGSVQRVDEARAEASLADARLTAAEARRHVFAGLAADSAANAPIPIESPIEGLLQRVDVLSGQVVPAGARLFEVIRPDPMWIRVAIYAGDLAIVDVAADALIAGLAGSANEAPRPARPVPAPFSANNGASTVDLFYEVPNAGAQLRPGQSVNATIALRSEEESLVVPWAAVLHDIQGGTWVYEATLPHVYVRRRVQVLYAVGGSGVLATGPKPGTMVVTDGAAELFGTEFGVGK